MNCAEQDLLLYAVTDRHWLHGRTLHEVVKESLDGGVTFLQLREKDLDEAHFLDEAKDIKTLCHAYGVPFLINDNVDIALAVDAAGLNQGPRAKGAGAGSPHQGAGKIIPPNALAMDADGVHVGQSDMEAGDVRAKLGPDKIIGVSAQTVAQALQAEAHGADYLGVGAVFPTGSKADAKEVEWDVLREICQAVSIPVVAIGGITQENVTELAGTGICGVAVISAIYAQEDIPAAAKNLKNTVKEMIAPQ